MSDSHALLAPSSAKQWLNCPPSARLSEPFPDTESSSAKEGSLAHSIAELKLRKHFTEPMGTRTYNSRMKPLKENPLYLEEMQGHTDAYLEYIKSVTMLYKTQPQVLIEVKFHLDAYIPKSFGKSDCIVLAGDSLHVIDFKYGKSPNGRVNAEQNPQMLLYALGALLYYQPFYAISTIHLTIFQPRLDNISEWSLSVAELLAWADSIKPIAQQAFNGEGTFAEGDWCRYCLAKAVCRACAETQLSLQQYGLQPPPLLSNTELGDALTRGLRLLSWLDSVEKYVLDALLKGEDIAGWKVVEGRSVRQFTDADAAFDIIKHAGYDEALLYERKPLTLSKIEMLLGKTKFTELLTPFVHKPKGKPALAEQTDSRAQYDVANKAADVFTKQQ